jgi:uncharacterized OB-fold protein
MSDHDPIIEGRPLPQPDHVSRVYWEAAARGDVLYQVCPSCGNRQWYPRAVCTACGADPEWATASGRGTVHTYTVVRQNLGRPWRDMTPYVVAMVELEEGPRIMTNITDCDPDEVRIGMPVEAYTVTVEDGLGLPFWRPAKRGLAQ